MVLKCNFFRILVLYRVSVYHIVFYFSINTPEDIKIDDKVYSKLGLKFLDFDVIRRAKKMAMSNYVLTNKAITTKEEKVLLGLRDRRARKILAELCGAGIFRKVGATSNLKYVLKI